ncbi:zinc finger protein 551-like [Ruditapes philippinarum]|uniref:zinc finger protein 551-like n=1 Tax=Ruditapes philippinarum TaxID=129788 RepID=UPI00295B488E|nr:zinc finger protein 551-like [Ruditapes philippinarum]
MADAAENPAMNLCNVCGKNFKRRQDLRRHERGHEGKGPYRCCGRVFREKNEYSQHRCDKHGAPRMFACQHSDCKSSFATNHALKRHVNEVHPLGPRRFSCDNCNEEFCYRYQLSNHISVKHNHERNHRCTRCGKSYVFSLRSFSASEDL